jgi:alpha-amylase
VERKSGEITVVLEREGKAYGCPLKLSKKIVLRENDRTVIINYALTNLSASKVSVKFGSEFNFAMLGGDSPDRFYRLNGKDIADRKLASIGEEKEVSKVELIDKWMKINVSLEFSEKAVLWRFPIETISQSIGKLEKVYQSSAVVPFWNINIYPGETKNIIIKKKVEDAD